MDKWCWVAFVISLATCSILSKCRSGSVRTFTHNYWAEVGHLDQAEDHYNPLETLTDRETKYNWRKHAPNKCISPFLFRAFFLSYSHRLHSLQPFSEALQKFKTAVKRRRTTNLSYWPCLPEEQYSPLFSARVKKHPTPPCPSARLFNPQVASGRRPTDTQERAMHTLLTERMRLWGERIKSFAATKFQRCCMQINNH